ncbi:DUF4129 domain-containing protein [Mycobacterium sp.]|uniref:DUF4129 domain-containing protein n=1 Tax=Mycobacterium sp. TaxID=1785 RepID=UPI002D4A76E1|nr:DUF4129 domain-containing protein [Mycobacterium sp.]HZA11487.1 DUF4129 domain-containing protein [Mycobacterium sp.]
MPMMLIDRDAAHDAAQQELSKAIYPKATLRERITEWIDDLFYKLTVEGSSVPGGWLTIAILVTILGVAVVVAIRIARNTMRTKRGGDYPLFGSAELSAAEHRATAQRFAAQGDWAAAIRHRLRAIARQLEEDGVLTAVPGRTANELARDAAHLRPDLASDLSTAATSFNDVTYGKRPGTEAEYRQIARVDERLGSRPGGSPFAAMSNNVTDSWAHVQ